MTQRGDVLAMPEITDRDLDRIAKALDAENWKLDRKSARVLMAYPPDKNEPPLRLVTCTNKAARNVYVALRRWGLDLEPTRSSGRKTRNTLREVPADLVKPKAVPAHHNPPILPAVLPGEAASGWRMSGHALEQAEKRHLSIAEIEAAIVAPEMCLPSGQGTEVRRLGDVKIVVNPDTKSVITVADLNESRQIRNGGQGLAQSKFVRANTVSTQEPPKPVSAPPATPGPPSSGAVEARVSDQAVRSMAARIRATSSRGKKFGTWAPPKPKPDTLGYQQPTLPMVWMTPAISSWLSDVVLRRLKTRPATWASILHFPDRLSAQALARSVESRLPELEIAVRDTAIYARWTGGVRR